MTGNISFERDILETNTRKIDYSFYGFKCYKIIPALISVPGYIRGGNSGFDVHIAGTLNHKLSFIACYAKKNDATFEMVKLYALNKVTQQNIIEAKMTLNYFERNFLRKKCQLEILTKK